MPTQFEQYCVQGQVGGRPRRGADMPVMAGLNHMLAAGVKGNDLTAAYYTVVRQLLWDTKHVS